MIYACQHCGAWFTSEEINKASKNRDAVIQCSFCNYSNEFLNPNASRLTRAYNALEEGRFGDAINVLTMEIEESRRKFRTPSPDAYLGLALARFGVRTIFDSTDAKRMGDPKLSCWDYNDMYFADDDNFIKARGCFEQFNASSEFQDAGHDRRDVQTSDNIREKSKIMKIMEYIDTVKDYYEEIRNSKKKEFKYGVFIAFEDEGDVAASWEMIATKVKNELPKMPVFMPPDKSMFESELQYDARMMYALHHSNCMVVLVGDNPSTRLRDMYTWYYNHGHETKGANLGFIHHNSHLPIRIPNGTVNKDHLFDTKEPDGYADFIARWNNIIKVQTGSTPKTPTPLMGEPAHTQPGPTGGENPKTDVYKIIDDHHLAFGHYPQTQEKTLAVTQHFHQYERPDKTDDRGWTVLFRNHKGDAYTWYRDAVINEERYRAVYFTQFREKCSVRESTEKSLLQKQHGYVLRTVYCFKFEPIVWDVEKIDPRAPRAVLVSDRGIDSREYNNFMLDNDWDACSIHAWLNEDFYENAFEDSEKNILCRFEAMSEDKVFLMDKDEDRLFVDRHNNIAGSDYYKCLGGMGDRCIGSCWITDKNNGDHSEASVIYPTTQYTLDHVKVDNTSVAVLPKVVITLKIGDEKKFKV